jgi:nucleotidyltransferase substrate binding protein (TIGR01987 family)
MTKLPSLRKDLASAIARLDEALALPKDSIVRDSAIQRFEIAFELCWKTLKAFLEEEHNAVCTSPRTCFKAAFKNALIGDDPFWIDMTKLRNYTVHTYNETLAEYVYGALRRIPLVRVIGVLVVAQEGARGISALWRA